MISTKEVIVLNNELKKGLAKWALSVAGLIACYLIFGEIGILFGVGLAYVIISYM